MPRTGHRIKPATLADMDLALQDMLEGLGFNEIERGREWDEDDRQRWLCCAEQVFELMYCRSANC